MPIFGSHEVILTDRSKYGAGADFINDPTSDVFHNATLRSNMYVMWKTIAARYLSYDYIAAYEIMSEPRDKSATFSQIHDFYTVVDAQLCILLILEHLA